MALGKGIIGVALLGIAGVAAFLTRSKWMPLLSGKSKKESNVDSNADTTSSDSGSDSKIPDTSTKQNVSTPVAGKAVFTKPIAPASPAAPLKYDPVSDTDYDAKTKVLSDLRNDYHLRYYNIAPDANGSKKRIQSIEKYLNTLYPVSLADLINYQTIISQANINDVRRSAILANFYNTYPFAKKFPHKEDLSSGKDLGAGDSTYFNFGGQSEFEPKLVLDDSFSSVTGNASIGGGSGNGGNGDSNTTPIQIKVISKTSFWQANTDGVLVKGKALADKDSVYNTSASSKQSYIDSKGNIKQSLFYNVPRLGWLNTSHVKKVTSSSFCGEYGTNTGCDLSCTGELEVYAPADIPNYGYYYAR